MTEIYVIRHVQAEGNLYRHMQGHWDGDVTPLGRAQGARLAERFRGIPVDAVYSSDLYRAVFTAECVARGHGLPVRTDARLREINVGPWEAKPFANVLWEQGAQFETFMHDPEHFSLAGAETYHEVRARAVEALCAIARENEGRTAVIASHGITIRCMLTWVLGISLNDEQTVPIFTNTGVAHLLYEDGAFRLDWLNDASHLSEAELSRPTRSPALRHEAVDPAAHRALYTACYADAWRSAHGDLEAYREQPYFDAACAHHRADGESVLLLYDGAEPAGLIDLDTERGAHAGYGWVSLLYLRPEYRGRGLGVQALGRAVSHYRKLGRTALRLHVSADNAAALAFYRSQGFVPLSEAAGAAGTLLLMEKQLRRAGHGTV